ncbi:MAG TPA: glutaredoxin family protein [Gemmataceae bacterium]|nr:glutaredoxin family protein [Gemmataceae bacterium]
MPFPWLFSWWPRAQLDHVEVVLYTRQGCHLCEDAWQLLQSEQQRHRFVLSAIDIDGDPELVKAHGECVPVVVVNGQVRFRGRINEVLWRRLLRAETTRRSGERGA